MSNNLFNNPYVEHALKSLSPEELERYKKMGEHMLSNPNILQTSVIKNPEDDMKQALMYIVEGINSGLHPTDLSKQEIKILREFYGENWYLKFGFHPSEIPHFNDKNYKI